MSEEPHMDTLEAPRVAPYTALADVYDVIMAEVEYDEWAEFILRVAEERGFRGGPLLDLGCGTGNATLPMWERGHEVEGLDASAAMLRVARRKLPGVGFTLGTFETFELTRRFGLVYSVFDALNNLLSDEAFAACLRRVHEHLTPGGVFVFDVNTPTGLRELWHGGVAEGWADDVYYRWNHAYDETTGLATVSAFCETEGAAFTEVHRERGYDEPHVRRLLEAAGFEGVAALAFPEAGPPPPGAERIWVVARKPQ
ncbi:MAG: methyltransferase domain-containing protein [Trueperaceae bacterium]|nr:methyltransferase domain-containing protein [Truepera sp.]HRN17705.1 methyltransferase domain-containing protein [Trueperaceae bacterium]